jgi:hypothetical protein
MKVVPNYIFFLHKFSGIFSRPLAIFRQFICELKNLIRQPTCQWPFPPPGPTCQRTLGMSTPRADQLNGAACLYRRDRFDRAVLTMPPRLHGRRRHATPLLWSSPVILSWWSLAICCAFLARGTFEHPMMCCRYWVAWFTTLKAL